MKAISLFCGAGGMDQGFVQAGFNIVWANDFDEDACATYEKNFGSHVVCGDINEKMKFVDFPYSIDCVFGGPPCQGFSVAGHMNPDDDRSKLVFSFMDFIEKVKPESFVMENVKALGTLEKFRLVREKIFKRAIDLGYSVELVILNSKDFGVPQSRERMFIIGFKDKKSSGLLAKHMLNYQKPSPTVREAIKHLGPAGGEHNEKVVKAIISPAKSPILRSSPYAGMLFNGQGRPIDPDSYSSTLHASMGGNRTPIIDEDQLYLDKPSWVEMYHKHLMENGKPYAKEEIPKRLRRLTLDEARILQTFPEGFVFVGRQSSVFRQIGNAVPCNLAEAVALMVADILKGNLSLDESNTQKNQELDFAF